MYFGSYFFENDQSRVYNLKLIMDRSIKQCIKLGFTEDNLLELLTSLKHFNQYKKILYSYHL